MFEKFRKIKKCVLSNPFLFFADFLLKAVFKLTVYTVMINYGITSEIPCLFKG